MASSYLVAQVFIFWEPYALSTYKVGCFFPHPKVNTIHRHNENLQLRMIQPFIPNNFSSSMLESFWSTTTTHCFHKYRIGKQFHDCFWGKFIKIECVKEHCQSTHGLFFLFELGSMNSGCGQIIPHDGHSRWMGAIVLLEDIVGRGRWSFLPLTIQKLETNFSDLCRHEYVLRHC